MQIDPSSQAPRPAWDLPASTPGTCRRSFRILERLQRRRPSQASTPRLPLYFSPRRPPTRRPVSLLGRAGARRPLPLCFSLRRRPFASCQSPARTQVAGAVFSGDGPPAPSRVRSREGAVRGDAPGTVAGVKMPPVPSTTEMTVQIFR